MNIKIGLIREEKNPPDNRIPLSPEQCKDALALFPGIEIIVESSGTRCFSDLEFEALGIPVATDLSSCDILMGVKEVPIEKLIPGKTYFFFSHTKKKQPYNQKLMHALIAKKIRMIDYEALAYEDGTRILGFGFYAGVVGAHNGLLTYGRKHKKFELVPAHQCKNMQAMMAQYRQVSLPPVKIALTGSGRVAAGLMEVMQHWDIQSIEPGDFLRNDFDYPVYTLLKGAALYRHRQRGDYRREEFHQHPGHYECLFEPYLKATDILMNGIYWDKNIPILFAKEALRAADTRLSVIADVTCDPFGSVPVNLRASTIADPVYGVRKSDFGETDPYRSPVDTVDIMAVDNLPNELPRDASQHFGESLIKYIFPELLKEKSLILAKATICEEGKLGEPFEYLSDYAYSSP